MPGTWPNLRAEASVDYDAFRPGHRERKGVLVDTEQLENGSRIDATIAIVGGGVAGIVLALELADAGIDVAIIESGDDRPDSRIQELYGGTCTLRVADRDAIDISEYLIESRFRELGGSGNYWGGKCAPLDAFDFERKDWIAHSGWPIDRAQMNPFYERACRRLEIPALTSDGLFGAEGTALLRGSGQLGTAPYCFTRYTSVPRHNAYRDLRLAVTGHARIKAYLKAHATRVSLRRDGRIVASVEVRCLNDRRHRVRASAYVLATGGIENARLLLASNDVQREGVGNHAGWVGRGFQIHAGLTEGNRTVAALFRTPEQLRFLFEARNDRPYAVVGSSQAMQRRLRAADLKVTFRRIPVRRRGGTPDREAAAAAQLAQRLTGAASMTSCEMYYGIEHTPSRDSQLSLLHERLDSLGIPKVRLDIRLSAFDVDSFVRSSSAMAAELGRLDIGRLPAIRMGEDFAHTVRNGMARHHMGATRMSSVARDGVVDADCQVHSVDNLFVAGSSVFPTSGTANPTLTIVALALRLADHLRSEIAP